MQKPSKVFVMDTRNVGGRQHVIETMLSHQSKLRQIVSDQRAPGAAASKTKATTFSSAPATYHMSRKLSTQRARKQGRQLNEQEKADQNMLRRMDAYPLPAQRKQNPSDFTAHPVKLFRDSDDPSLHPGSVGGGSNGLSLPGSPRKLYQTMSHSSNILQPFASPSPISPRSRPASAHPRVTGLGPSTNSQHARQPVFRPDHFAGAVPRQRGAQGGYKRAALEVMEYTQGKPTSKRAIPTDYDEMDPNYRGVARRPASATVGRGSAPPGQNRDGTWRPLATSTGSYDRYAEDAADELDEMDRDGRNLDPYAQLKQKLFALIVEHRIFREKAILKLLEKARAINQHMNQAKLERVLDEIKIEFEIHPNARLSDPMEGDVSAGVTARSSRNSQTQLAARQQELRDLERDYKEDALQSKIDSAQTRQRLKDRLEDQRDQQDRKEASRGRSRSRSPSSSRSGSRRDSRQRSRSGSRSRSASRSPMQSGRTGASSRRGDSEEEF